MVQLVSANRQANQRLAEQRLLISEISALVYSHNLVAPLVAQREQLMSTTASLDKLRSTAPAPIWYSVSGGMWHRLSTISFDLISSNETDEYTAQRRGSSCSRIMVDLGRT